MKKTTFLLAVVIVGLLSSFKLAEEWKRYTYSDANFSVSLPSEPQVQDQDQTDDAGNKLKIHIAMSTLGETEAYMVSWVNVGAVNKKDKEGIQKILEGSRDGAVGTLNVTKVETTASNYTSKEPYVEFTFENAQMAGKSRIYYINGYQYVLMAMYELKGGVKPNADKFIGSFKHD